MLYYQLNTSYIFENMLDTLTSDNGKKVWMDQVKFVEGSLLNIWSAVKQTIPLYSTSFTLSILEYFVSLNSNERLRQCF